MTKVGNWRSRKAYKQDMARRAGSPPAGRTALPKHDKHAPVEPAFGWALRVFIGFWAVVIGLGIYFLTG